jgi:hypothetical protein
MRQLKPGQLQTGSLYNISASFALTASTLSGNAIVPSASFAVTASYALQSLSASYAPFTPTNTGSLLVTASISNATITFTKGNGTTFPITVDNVTSSSFASTASYIQTAQTASYVETAQTASYVLQAVSSSFSTTASYAVSASQAATSSHALNAISSSFTSTASYYQETDPVFTAISGTFATTGSNTFNGLQTINGNVNINGTASITFLNVTYESASVIYSSGSNQFGDSVTDTQSLFGTVIVSGSLQVTGSANLPSITGSLFGTASWAQNSITASYVQTAQTASYVLQAVSSSFASTASFVQQAVSASFATSASWAPTTPTFPFTGSALITGSLGVTGSLTTLGLSSFINPLTYSGNQTTVPLISLNQPLLSFGNSSVIFRATETSVNNSFAVELYKRSGNSETRFLVGGTGTGTNTERPFMTVIGTNTAGEGSVTFDRSVGIGSTPSSSIRLDVRTQGALSTDIAFRVRNNADTDNIISVKGNRNIFLLGETDNGRIELSANGGNASMVHRATAILPSQFIIGSLGDGGSVGQIVFAALDGTNTYPTFTMQRLISGLSDLTGASLYSGFGTNAATFVMKNANGYAGIGTNPTGTATDHFAMYSADVAAGTASAHFRNEAGHVVKLYTQSPVTSSQGIADALTNLGFLTGSSTITPTFPYTGSAQITGSVIINNYINTAVHVTAAAGATTIYTLPTASYDGAWFEYSARSGSNARAGQITAIWSGSAVNFTETATTDFGTTADLALGVFIVGAGMALTASAATSGWIIKTIIRSM